jgi:hypothetical protein
MMCMYYEVGGFAFSFGEFLGLASDIVVRRLPYLLRFNLCTSRDDLWLLRSSPDEHGGRCKFKLIIIQGIPFFLSS